MKINEKKIKQKNSNTVLKMNENPKCIMTMTMKGNNIAWKYKKRECC